MHRRGFTLIELLVVISIIGILSGIIVTGLNSARVSSRDSDRISDLKNIQLALAQYYNDNGHYPCQLSDNTITIQGDPGCPPVFSGNYMATLPVDPSTGTSYKYTAMVRSTLSPPQACNLGVSFYHLGAVVENSEGSYMSQDDSYIMDINGGITVAGATYVQCINSLPAFHSNATACFGFTGVLGSPDPCFSVGPN
jgi:general secretion pathway protein G